MVVNNVFEFKDLLLQCGLRKLGIEDINDIFNCVVFYSNMCGCEEEAKAMKLTECEEKYVDFVTNKLDLVKNELLNYHSIVIFNNHDQFIGNITSW